jgi:acetyl esterase/lipase
MSQRVYYHSAPQSTASKLIQLFMGLFGMKRAMEKKIANNSYSKVPASIPKSIQRELSVSEFEVKRRKVWKLTKKNGDTGTIIIYLHGGAYYANITRQHWLFIEQLANGSNAIVVVPDYPLAPEHSCAQTYEFVDDLYAKLISDYPTHRIIAMGDSAGGGLALGYAQKICSESVKQPEQIILFSPWLDVTMSNPDIARIDKSDKILSINGLKMAGERYAADLNVTDYRVSPIYGNFSKIGRVSIFAGTNDMLIADARKCIQIMERNGLDFYYFEYPNMFHDWIVVPSLTESKDVIEKVCRLIKS